MKFLPALCLLALMATGAQAAKISGKADIIDGDTIKIL